MNNRLQLVASSITPLHLPGTKDIAHSGFFSPDISSFSTARIVGKGQVHQPLVELSSLLAYVQSVATLRGTHVRIVAVVEEIAGLGATGTTNLEAKAGGLAVTAAGARSPIGTPLIDRPPDGTEGAGAAGVVAGRVGNGYVHPHHICPGVTAV
jgi:hypothetical protein